MLNRHSMSRSERRQLWHDPEAQRMKNRQTQATGQIVTVSNHLPTGAENAITGTEICAMLNISQRELTSAIERERRAGKPICASTDRQPGYFLAADKGEMQRFCKSLFHRAGEIHKTRKACMATIDSLPEKADYNTTQEAQ